MGRRSSALLAAIAVLVPGAAALAQQAPAAPAPNEPSPAAAPGDAPVPSAPSPAPADAASAAPAKRGGEVTGYGYGDTPSRAAGTRAAGPARHPSGKLKHHPNEVVATHPGFEMLPDGGSRLFVQLSKSVDVDQAKGEPAPHAARKSKRAHASKKPAAAEVTPAASSVLTVTMRGTEAVNRIDELALVTVHFNTPVVRARLVPHGGNLALVIEMRADVTPSVKTVPTKDNGSMLQVDFPAGTYLSAAEQAQATAPPGPASAPETVPGGVSNSVTESE